MSKVDKSIQNPKTLIVHSGVMHADDIMTAAILSYAYPGIEIKRMLDKDITEEMKEDSRTLICDIGKEYNPKKGLFDHHNDCTLMADGVKHSAVGLILPYLPKEFRGKMPQELLEQIDMIEHVDNGATHPLYDHNEYNLATFANVMNPTWNSNANSDSRFMEAVTLFREHLVEPMMEGRYSKSDELAMRSVYETRLAESEQALKDAEYLVTNAYNASKDRIVVLPQFAPWQSYLVDKDADFVIFPSNRGGYNLQCVPPELGSFDKKVELPDWHGDVKPEGMTFEAPGLFIAGFDTLEHALNAAKQVEMDHQNKGQQNQQIKEDLLDINLPEGGHNDTQSQLGES